jgi:hypothetical protein
MNLIAKLREKIDLHGSFQRVFGDPDLPDGKVVLRAILREGFVTRTTFVAGDPHQTALNEGSRRLALSILRHVHRDHKEMVNQVEEMIREEQNHE